MWAGSAASATSRPPERRHEPGWAQRRPRAVDPQRDRERDEAQTVSAIGQRGSTKVALGSVGVPAVTMSCREPGSGAGRRDPPRKRLGAVDGGSSSTSPSTPARRSLRNVVHRVQTDSPPEGPSPPIEVVPRTVEIARVGVLDVAGIGLDGVPGGLAQRRRPSRTPIFVAVDVSRPSSVLHRRLQGRQAPASAESPPPTSSRRPGNSVRRRG